MRISKRWAILRAGEMAQQWRALAAIPEDLSLVVRAQTVQLTTALATGDLTPF